MIAAGNTIPNASLKNYWLALYSHNKTDEHLNWYTVEKGNYIHVTR